MAEKTAEEWETLWGKRMYGESNLPRYNQVNYILKETTGDRYVTRAATEKIRMTSPGNLAEVKDAEDVMLINVKYSLAKGETKAVVLKPSSVTLKEKAGTGNLGVYENVKTIFDTPEGFVFYIDRSKNEFETGDSGKNRNYRIYLRHPAGTYVNIADSGEYTRKVMTNSFDFITGDMNIGVKKNYNLVADEEIRINAGRHHYLSIAGNSVYDTKGRLYISAGGNMLSHCHADSREIVDGAKMGFYGSDLYQEASGIITIYGKKKVIIKTDELEDHSNRKILKIKGNIKETVAGHRTIGSDQMTITSTGTGGSFNVMSGGKYTAVVQGAYQQEIMNMYPYPELPYSFSRKLTAGGKKEDFVLPCMVDRNFMLATACTDTWLLAGTYKANFLVAGSWAVETTLGTIDLKTKVGKIGIEALVGEVKASNKIGEVKIDALGNVQMKNKGGEIKVHSPLPEIELKNKSKGKIKIDMMGKIKMEASIPMKGIELGKATKDQSVYGKLLIKYLSTHFHGTGVGPSSPPVVPPNPMELLSKLVWIE